MTTTTDEFWDVDGTPLQTHARNLVSWGGDREGARPLRGEDQVIPYAPGRRWTRKVVDSYTMSLSGWVLGADDDGVIGDQQEFRTNWRALRRLLWTPNRQIALTKRWRDEAGTLISATAQAQYVGGLVPQMTGGTRAEFDVDLFLADPFFYGDPVTVPLPLGATTVVDVPGDYDTSAIGLALVGPLTAARVTNESLTPPAWVQYLTLPDGSTADLDVGLFTARQDDGGGDYKAIGNVSHDGAIPWLLLTPGSNSLTVSTTDGTGTIALTYRPVYL